MCLLAAKLTSVCHAIHPRRSHASCGLWQCASAATGAVMGARNAVTTRSSETTTPRMVSSTCTLPSPPPPPGARAGCRRYHRYRGASTRMETFTRTRAFHPPRARVDLSRTRYSTSCRSDSVLCAEAPNTSSQPSNRRPGASSTADAGSTAAPRNTSSSASAPSPNSSTRSSAVGSVTSKVRCSKGDATRSLRPSNTSRALTRVPRSSESPKGGSSDVSRDASAFSFFSFFGDPRDVSATRAFAGASDKTASSSSESSNPESPAASPSPRRRAETFANVPETSERRDRVNHPAGSPFAASSARSSPSALTICTSIDPRHGRVP
mmetsp:Transcript_12003/g.51527  ORF Transcript_12003/g.51527 Transcript_12003/m.51527 type:complete len:323 (+) Transcript_12003:2566-3534(+)